MDQVQEHIQMLNCCPAGGGGAAFISTDFTAGEGHRPNYRDPV